jgi:bifunctional DNA primase/polymerase-like protein
MTDDGLLDWAARLVVRGVNVIPCRGKYPVGGWKRWQEASQLEALPGAELDEYLLRWWRDSDFNVGAVAGPVSGIAVIDADSPDAIGAVMELLPEDIETPMVETAKGLHVWLAYPEGAKFGNRARIGGLGLDVRGRGGQAICPPSIHPSGKAYRWLSSPLETWPPAELPPALLDLIQATPEPPGDRPQTGAPLRDPALCRRCRAARARGRAGCGRGLPERHLEPGGLLSRPVR